MGEKALRRKRTTERKIRGSRLSESEKAFLREHAFYEGSPRHKKNPGDFGLTPPAAPRQDKTLCDEAGIFKKENASSMFQEAIEAGVVSEGKDGDFPKQLWFVDAKGQAFEAIYGGSRTGAYHGYPIRKSDPFREELLSVWRGRK